MAAVWKQLWAMVCTPYGDGNYLPTFFHGLISNGFVHLILNLSCGTMERDSAYAFFTCTDGQGCASRSVPNLLWKLLKFCQYWTYNNTGGRKKGRLPFHLACGALYCAFWNSAGGWGNDLQAWLIFSFMQMCQCWKTLLLIKFEIPKGKAYVSPLYCAWCSAHYG